MWYWWIKLLKLDVYLNINQLIYFFGLTPLSLLPFLAFEIMWAFVFDFLAPGAGPKWRYASRHLVGPLKNIVLRPVGASRASWSKVKQRPPAFKIRARAVRVNLNAQTVILGTLKRRTSSVTVDTTTRIFFSLSSAGRVGAFKTRAWWTFEMSQLNYEDFI